MKTKLSIILLITSLHSYFAQIKKLHDFKITDDMIAIHGFETDGSSLFACSAPSSLSGGDGFIYKISTNGTGYTVLKTFSQATSGANPDCKLCYDGTYLYGTTREFNSNNTGTIFRIKPDGSGFLKLYEFTVPNDGYRPSGGLVTDGTYLYGGCSNGGINFAGTIYKIKKDGTGFTKLIDMTPTGGGGPEGLLLLNGGFLYGTTVGGGANFKGTIFKIKTDGTGFANLYDFDTPTGEYSLGALVTDGTHLYGTTLFGGSNTSGVLFKIKTDGTGYTVMHHFVGGTDGEEPRQGPSLSNGYVYGLTSKGGNTAGDGTIYKIKTDGTGYTVPVKLGVATGGWPGATLLFINTAAYFNTSSYGTHASGTIVRYDPACGSMETTVTQSGSQFIASAGAVSYQWLDCNNGSAVIPGATTETFNAGSGSYALRFEESFCIDTSACRSLTFTGVREFNTEDISFGPNPASDYVEIVFPSEQNWTIVIYDVTGKLVSVTESHQAAERLDISSLVPSVYYLEVRRQNEVIARKKLLRN